MRSQHLVYCSAMFYSGYSLHQSPFVIPCFLLRAKPLRAIQILGPSAERSSLSDVALCQEDFGTDSTTECSATIKTLRIAINGMLEHSLRRAGS